MAKKEERLPQKEVTTAPVKKADGKTKEKFRTRVAKWFRGMKSELKKVIWPTKKQVMKNTAIALGVMVVSAIAIWGFDSLASAGVNVLLKLVG